LHPGRPSTSRCRHASFQISLTRPSLVAGDGYQVRAIDCQRLTAVSVHAMAWSRNRPCAVIQSGTTVHSNEARGEMGSPEMLASYPTLTHSLIVGKVATFLTNGVRAKDQEPLHRNNGPKESSAVSSSSGNPTLRRVEDRKKWAAVRRLESWRGRSPVRCRPISCCSRSTAYAFILSLASEHSNIREVARDDRRLSD
jgi:hypothetical protein